VYKQSTSLIILPSTSHAYPRCRREFMPLMCVSYLVCARRVTVEQIVRGSSCSIGTRTQLACRRRRAVAQTSTNDRIGESSWQKDVTGLDSRLIATVRKYLVGEKIYLTMIRWPPRLAVSTIYSTLTCYILTVFK
jgi:hypothetical protein